MTPEQELAQLRARLLMTFFDVCGSIRKVSEPDPNKNVNMFRVIVTEALTEVDKLHAAYADFARAQFKALSDKAKEKK